jgi:hypothetical protein
MKHLAAIALAAVATLFAASTPSGASNSSHAVRLSPTGTWTFTGLAPAERANVAADIAVTVPAARQVLDLIDGAVAIDPFTNLCVVGDACSHPDPSAGRPWTIHLPHGTLDGTFPSERFIVLHEIGHAVWSLVFRQVDRDAFATAVDRSLDHRDCRATNGRACAPLFEMFADEFARWAGNFDVCMDTYYTPALLTPDAFGSLVDRALAARV